MSNDTDQTAIDLVFNAVTRKKVINPTGNTMEPNPETEAQIPEFLLKKKTILLEAESLIYGPRKDSYGSVEESFSRIAKLATMFTDHKLTATDIAWIMIAVKLGREINSHSRDNLVDLAGYVGLLGQLLGDE